MPKLTCPVKGQEAFNIEFPDEWLMGDYEKFVRGMQTAQAEKKFNNNSSVNVARFYGCKAVCSLFEGAPEKPLELWPLAVFMWFLNALYYGETGLDKALNPPKN